MLEPVGPSTCRHVTPSPYMLEQSYLQLYCSQVQGPHSPLHSKCSILGYWRSVTSTCIACSQLWAHTPTPAMLVQLCSSSLTMSHCVADHSRSGVQAMWRGVVRPVPSACAFPSGWRWMRWPPMSAGSSLAWRQRQCSPPSPPNTYARTHARTHAAS